MELKAYSLLTGDVLDLGPTDADPDELLELGAYAATIAPGTIVFTEGPTLQTWEDA